MAVPTGLTPAQLQVLLEGPALSPPLGVEPNFDNPYAFGTALQIIRKRGPEDYLAILAWALYVAYVAIAIMCGYPVGRHQWDVKFKDMKHWMYHIHIGTMIYGAICFIIKLSILLQYIRIFSSKQRGLFFWTCNALIFLNFTFYTVCLFLEIFSCRPIAKAWNPLIIGTCLDYPTLNTISAAFSSASDFAIFLLPQPLIWKFQMSFKKRLGVSFIFLVALLACISAIMRLYYSVKLADNDDVTWYVSLMGSFVFPELGLGIVVICLPTIPELFKTVTAGSIFSRVGTTASSHGGGGRQSPHDKARLDGFDRLVDNYENPSLRKHNTTATREIEVPIIPRGTQILRTVHVKTESQQQPEVSTARIFGLNHQDRPWDGTHEHKVTVSRL
ncbi:uncharacterized protein BP5553_09674 [Venustampulla echinocandica]|uniref:Rhodopsin domain-containing protein n=1 Tax=Venustampulla echinocandica TaxID=2656787 RepID=A0A370TBP5_9HELO|nr:uncharacterized protein BP5553_09674 [Venustampulla echinocandica]RDL31465.1 hypothetical protein BP5553_09674 [Venustampulla echinocandica]